MNRYFVLCILFFIYSITSSFNLRAANKTFTGGAGGNFSDATKWNLGTLPVAGDNLRINGTCTFDNAANNLVYGTIDVGRAIPGTLNWPVGGTNTLNVTAVSSTTAGSTIDMTNGGTLQIRTSWTTTNQTFTPGTGTIDWNVTGANSTLPATITTYNNLTIDATGRTVTLGVATIINGNLSIDAGTFASSTLQITGNATGTMTMAAGTALTLGTNVSATNVLFPTNFTAGNINLNVTSTVTYQTNGAQTVSIVPTYGNLTSTSGVAAATKTLSGTPLAIAGNLTLNSANDTFDGSANTINLTGNLSGTGGLSFTTGTLNIGGNNTHSGTFTSGTGTVDYNGSGAQTVRGTTYNNLTISNAGTSTLGAATIVNANLSITGGTLASSTFQITGNASGTMSMSAGTILTLGTTGSATVVNFPTTFTTANITLNATSTATYQGNYNQSISSTPTYGNLTLDDGAAATTKTPTGATLNVAGDLTLSAASTTLSATTKTINLTGDLSGAGGLSFSSGTLNIGGDNTQTGTFTKGTSTVNYNGSGTQIVRATNYNNLTFSTSGTKTIASGTTGVGSNFTVNNSASIDATTNSTTINFNGAGGQTVSGNSTDFYNINISTGTSVSLSSAQRLIGTITLNGTGTFNTNNQFTLVSTSSATGNIAALATPANFSGNITMQRYVSGAMGYRYIGSAVSGALLSGLTPEIELDGMVGGTLPTWWCNVYTYDESATGNFAGGWINAGNVTDPMTTGKGFAVYFYSTNIPVTLDLTGPANKGNQPLPVTFSNNSPDGTYGDNWNLVSNPYPSTIDWDAAAGWTRTNIQGNTFYCWDDASQNYASYPAGGPGVNGGTRYIASSQGFLVQANASGPVLSITENVKASANPTPQFWKTGSTNPYAIKLKIVNDANSYTDESVIRFIGSATNNIDIDYDARKIISNNAASPYLATLSYDSAYLCINSLPDLTQEFTVPIEIKAGVAANFEISVELLNGFPLNACLVLEDLDNSTITNIKSDLSYSFFQDISSAPIKRFLLHISPPILDIESKNVTCYGQNNGLLIIKGNSATPWDYNIFDSIGNNIGGAVNINYVDTVVNLSAGNYIVLSSNSAVYCNSGVDTIIITENPAVAVTATSSDISCKGINDGYATITASGGSGIYAYLWSNGKTTSSISNLPAAKYYVTVNDENFCSLMDSVIIQEGPVIVQAGFTASSDTVYLSSGGNVQFTNTSTGASSYYWTFDDSLYSIAINPYHTYSDTGIYFVKMKAFTSSGCEDSVIYKVVVLQSPVSIAENNLKNIVQIYSSNGNAIIKWNSQNTSKINIRVLNTIGQEIFSSENISFVQGMEYKIDFLSYAEGIYFVHLTTDKNQLIKKINYLKE